MKTRNNETIKNYIKKLLSHEAIQNLLSKKKKKIAELMFLIQNRSITFNKHIFFYFKNEFIISAKDG